MRRSTFVIILIAIFVLSLFGIMSWMGDRVQPLERDVMLSGQEALGGVKRFIANFRSAADLQKKYDALQEENIALKKNIGDLSLQSKENEELKKILNFTSKKELQTVNGRIYGYQAVELSRAFFDGGAGEGIVKGDVVLSASGNFIGVISHVREGVSEITYLSSPEVALQVTGSRFQEVVGVTEGGNHIEVKVGLIPASIQLKKGDFIFSAIEGTIPGEFLIGTVESVSSHPSDLFQSAVVTFVEPLSKVVRGSVVLGHKQNP